VFKLDPIFENQIRALNAEPRRYKLLGAFAFAGPVIMFLFVAALILSAFGYYFLWWIVGPIVALGVYAIGPTQRGSAALQAAEPPPTTFGSARFMSASYPEDAAVIGEATANRRKGRPEPHFLGFYRNGIGGVADYPDGQFHPMRTGPDMLTTSGPGTIYYDKPAHLLTVAPSRSGKGTDVIVPNLMNSTGRSFVVIDPKGENAAITAKQRRAHGDVFLLNPFNELKLGTNHFNPLSHLTIDHPRVFADCKSLAEALVPSDANPSGNSEYFNSGAGGLVQALLLHLLETKGREATLTDIRPILTSKAALDRALFAMTEKSGFRPLRELAAKFVKETKSIDEIISTAQVKTDFLSEPAFEKCLSKSDFEFIDLKGKPTTVYVILPSRYLATYSAFMRLLMVAALDELQTAEGGNVPTTFLLDEFAALGYLSHFEDAVGKIAGYGVQLWPFVQDLNQLKSLYKDRWETFVAAAGVVQWFAPQDQFSQTYLSKRLGQKTVVTRSTSTSKGTSQRVGLFGFAKQLIPSVTASDNEGQNIGETGQPLMAPNELAGLGRHHQLITYTGYSYPLLGARFPYFITQGELFALGVDEVFANRVLGTFGWFDLEPNPYFKS